MGRQSRLKRQRRTATFNVRSPGILEVLSVGKGDLKIAIGDSNKDRADAQRLIEEMLRKGYTLFVETADGPLKVTRFLPDAMAYAVVDTPEVVSAAEPHIPGDYLDGREDEGDLADLPPEPEQAPAPRRPRKPRIVPVAGSKTTAIGRTAGG